MMSVSSQADSERGEGSVWVTGVVAQLHDLTGQWTHFSRRHGSGSTSRFARRVLETCTKTRTGGFRWLVGDSTRPAGVEGSKKVRLAISK
jgi:hypothetical protein